MTAKQLDAMVVMVAADVRVAAVVMVAAVVSVDKSKYLLTMCMKCF